MSCDDDYDMWEPVIDVVEERKLVEIEINAITKSDLLKIEKAATQALRQKLCKLSVVLKNLDVYCCDNTLLVNDRYGICKDLQEIVEAFGMRVTAIECGLRGKSYLIQDDLVALISMIDPNFSLNEFANKTLTNELQSTIKKTVSQYSVDKILAEIFKTIMETGRYTITGQQTVITTYEDGIMTNKTVGEVISDSDRITAKLKTYMQATSSSLKNANENLRNGTVKLLYSRARQMGYAVKEEHKGTQVQLVLVRTE